MIFLSSLINEVTAKNSGDENLSNLGKQIHLTCIEKSMCEYKRLVEVNKLNKSCK